MKVTVITVSYNSENTIRDTIESVLSQSYKNVEYLIVDGGSKDRTVEIIKSYENQFENEKDFKWISEKDDGLYHAINKGIDMASGDIVGILNSDDFYSDQDVLSDIVSNFINDVDCIYGNLVYVKTENTDIICRKWKSKSFKKGLFEKSWTPAHPTFYCRKEIYDKFGVYRTDFNIASDVDLMYRFLDKYEVKSLYIDRLMVKMRAGGVSNRGLKSTITIIKELRISIKENGGNFNIFKYILFKLLKIKQLVMLRLS